MDRQLPSAPEPEHVIAVYRRAPVSIVDDGVTWYLRAHEVAKVLGAGRPNGLHVAAGVLAAYSPRSNWEVNVENARLALETGTAHGGSGTKAMSSHARVAQRILDGEPHQTALGGEKVRAFAHLIETGGVEPDGEWSDRVVIDRHAVSIAVGKRLGKWDIDKGPWHDVWSPTARGRDWYRQIADVYVRAAREVGIAPHQLQAATWLQYRYESGVEGAENGASGWKLSRERYRNRHQLGLFA